MLILNLKTYPESTGENLYKLLDAVKEFQLNDPLAAKNVFVAPSQMELLLAKSKYAGINFIAQHVDNVDPGSTTGWSPAVNVKGSGIEYSIYNHSEHRVWSDDIVAQITKIQSTGLKLIVCCENVEEAKVVLQANPFAIAYEPKDLIGSGISVTTRPEAVKEFIQLVSGKTVAIIGAGVTTGEDVKTSLELGAQGVLLASAFVKAPDPLSKLNELSAAFQR